MELGRIHKDREAESNAIHAAREVLLGKSLGSSETIKWVMQSFNVDNRRAVKMLYRAKTSIDAGLAPFVSICVCVGESLFGTD
jgi:hypothetical protein